MYPSTMARRVFTAMMCLTISGLPLAAQEWHLSGQAGRIRSALDPAGTMSESFALGIRYDDVTAGFRLTGGIPSASTDPLWGGVSGWKRSSIAVGRFMAAVDVAGNAFVASDRSRTAVPVPGPFDPPAVPQPERSGHALAGQLLPVVGFEAAHLQVHARGGLSRYAARFGSQDADRTVRLADIQVTVSPASTFALVPVTRWYKAAGESVVTYAGLSAVTASPAGSLWANVGRWMGGGEGTPWAAGGRLRLHPLVMLEASARRDTFDPLYLQPAQTSWSAGLSVRVGGRGRSLTPPVPSKYEGGRATIRLAASESKTAPSIAGDFNAWKPAPMRREGSYWTYIVAVDPGVYQYAFVRDSGEWFVPKSVAGRKDDGMGGHVAVLVVR